MTVSASPPVVLCVLVCTSHLVLCSCVYKSYNAACPSFASPVVLCVLVFTHPVVLCVLLCTSPLVLFVLVCTRPAVLNDQVVNLYNFLQCWFPEIYSHFDLEEVKTNYPYHYHPFCTPPPFYTTLKINFISSYFNIWQINTCFRNEIAVTSITDPV